MKKTFIKVRTQFQGFHCYPNASSIDPQIAFLEDKHRHLFKVEVKIEVEHHDRELEFFLVKWKIEEFLDQEDRNNQSCEQIANDILHFVLDNYGTHRQIEVTVSEDGESDGIIEYKP